jgi:hypothetical protein
MGGTVQKGANCLRRNKITTVNVIFFIRDADLYNFLLQINFLASATSDL